MRSHTGRIGWSLFAVALLAGCEPETPVTPSPPVSGMDARPALAHYTATLLPNCGGGRAWDVNANGMIVGSSNCTGSGAVWWTPTSKPMAYPGSGPSAAYGVNASGQAVGENGGQAAFWPDASHVFTLGDLGGGQSWAYDINDAGYIVGGSLIAGGVDEHAFLYYPQFGWMQDLGTLPGGTASVAWAISASGVVVGLATTSGGTSAHAVWWDAYGIIHDLGTLPGGPEAVAEGINAYNDIVGWSNLGGNVYSNHGFLYSHGTSSWTDLRAGVGNGSSWALDINNVGAIVGKVQFKTGVHGGVRLPRSTSWIDLGAIPNSEGNLAFAIDETCGYVVGYAYSGYGADQPVLWTGPPCP